ncbi:hypothetical protein [Saccharopolyspora hattusasensis]|uniref:hypothetical protein n=1 Tax=Saccharopolyspora hattusasensis TaxID=1128679 RepID=UPI003D98D947
MNEVRDVPKSAGRRRARAGLIGTAGVLALLTGLGLLGILLVIGAFVVVAALLFGVALWRTGHSVRPALVTGAAGLLLPATPWLAALLTGAPAPL